MASTSPSRAALCLILLLVGIPLLSLCLCNPICNPEVTRAQREIGDVGLDSDQTMIEVVPSKFMTMSNNGEFEMLTIDPLIYATAFGGSDIDNVQAIAVDSVGNTYVTGYTYSTDFPAINAYDNTLDGERDLYVLKLDPSGNEILYSTFIGGSMDEEVSDLAVDAMGNAYVTGWSDSSNFPTVNAFDNSNSGNPDCFVVKLSADGSTLLYSTFVGESGVGYSIDVDGEGNAYVTGQAGTMPMVNSYNPTPNGDSDNFVFKLNASGNGLVYSTYLGGSGFESPGTIAVDVAGCAYVAGITDSYDFPTVNAFDDSLSGDRDCFVLKLNAAGDGLVYSSYLGGSQTEEHPIVAVDGTGSLYITGSTGSSDFPLVNPFDGTLGGWQDAFLAKLSVSGDSLEYSTYIGGSEYDNSFGLVVDNNGNAYVAGTTESDDFPLVNAFDWTYSGDSDSFVFKMAANGSAMYYSTYIGGSSYDTGRSIAIDSLGNAYVGGDTGSEDFPIQTILNNKVDCYVLKLNSTGSSSNPPPGPPAWQYPLQVAGAGFLALLGVLLLVRFRPRLMNVYSGRLRPLMAKIDRRLFGLMLFVALISPLAAAIIGGGALVLFPLWVLTIPPFWITSGFLSPSWWITLGPLILSFAARLLYPVQTARYYEGRSSSRTTLLLGLAIEIPSIFWSLIFIMNRVIMIPLPVPLLVVYVLMMRKPRLDIDHGVEYQNGFVEEIV